jgi:hypothetical protein
LAIYGSAAAQQSALANAQAAASLAQGFAASAASVVQQDLSGVNAAALHRSPNAVTAMFLYDTSKDSDGGAWTEKCQHTSWFNEAVTGKWLGANDTEQLARFVGATKGAELCTDPSLDTPASWILEGPAGGFVVGGGKVTCPPVVAESASFRNGTTAYLTAGKTYELTYTVDSFSGNFGPTFAVIAASGSSGGVWQVGDYVSAAAIGARRVVFVAGGSGVLGLRRINGHTGTAVLDNLSIREVTALTTSSNDYFQLITDGKFYRLWKNLLSYSNNFENAVWTKGVSTVSPDAIAGPDGAVTADAIVESTTSGNQGLYRGLPDYGQKTFAFDVKAGGRQYFTMYWFAGSNSAQARLTVDLTTGAATQWVAANGGGNGYSYTITPKGNGWYRISGSYTRISGGFPSRVWFGPSDTPTASGESYNYLGDGRTAIYLSNFQIEEGLVATAYEAKTIDGSITEVFRGNKRKFPKLAGIVAEGDSVTIYDLTEAGRPMWMRFVTLVNTFLPTNEGNVASVTSVSVLNSAMVVGKTANQSYKGHLYVARFARDRMEKFEGTYGVNGFSSYGISYRNSNLVGFSQNGGVPNATAGGIPDGRVNAVAMTVLPDAPVDPATGLKVPTIAVGTQGGVSVIKHDGSVVSGGSGWNLTAVAIERSSLTVQRSGSAWYYNFSNVNNLGASFALNSVNPAPPDFYRFDGGLYNKPSRSSLRRASAALVLNLRPHENTFSRGIASAVTNTFNTGHMVGDIRRAYLADVDTGSVSGAELVVNGTFDTDTTGWGAIQGATLSVDANRLLITNGNFGAARQYITVVLGKTYILTGTYTAGTATTARLVSYSGNENGISTQKDVGTGPFSMVFVGQGVSCPIALQLLSGVAGQTGYFDNISVKECSADRSYKASGASITGTLTKTPVALGSQLVAYSGFSA